MRILLGAKPYSFSGLPEGTGGEGECARPAFPPRGFFGSLDMVFLSNLRLVRY